MNDLGSIQGTHYNHFSQQPLDTVSQPSLPDHSWFVDSRTTNHITLNLGNLSLHAPYNRFDKVSVGDGKQLPISNVGHGQLHTQTKLISTISLSNVLHIPHMKKNLLSVSQLTREHDLVAEFNSHSCLIKDKNSRQVLLKGCFKDGLY